MVLPIKMQKIINKQKRKKRVKGTLMVLGSVVLAITLASNHELKIDKEA